MFCGGGLSPTDIVEMRKKHIEWQLQDPKGKSIDEVRRIRDKIEGMVLELARKR